MIPKCHRATETVTASRALDTFIKQMEALFHEMVKILIKGHDLFAKWTPAVMIKLGEMVNNGLIQSFAGGKFLKAKMTRSSVSNLILKICFYENTG